MIEYDECPRCSECPGQAHHWMENLDVFGPGDPMFQCKHCEAFCDETDPEEGFPEPNDDVRVKVGAYLSPLEREALHYVLAFAQELHGLQPMKPEHAITAKAGITALGKLLEKRDDFTDEEEGSEVDDRA
jgi:hypothetical protein